MNAIGVTSHDDAKYMSFKVNVPRSHFDKMFDPDMWPEGVGVHKYVYPVKRANKQECLRWEDY